jgi:NADH-quinone oxidoreductase subunit M
MVMCFMAGCGLPGFANFAGELLVMFGAWKSLHFFVVCAAWGGLVIGAIYMLRAVRAVLHGPVAEKMENVSEFAVKDPLPENTGDLGALGGLTKAFHSALGGDLWRLWRKLPYALLLVALLVFGFVPSLLTNKIKPAIAEVVAAAKPRTVATVDPASATSDVASVAPNAFPPAQ